MSASEHLQPQQFRLDHERHDQGGSVRAYADGEGGQRWLGTMHYRVDQHPHGTTVDDIRVDQAARRQGVASRLYDEVHRETGRPFVHVGSEMSSEGRRTVRALAARQPELHRMAARTRNGNATSRAVR